jgi:hypothetical protein
MADYLVPKADVGVFTVGALPRDPDVAGPLQHLADRIVSVLDGRAMSYQELAEAMPDLSDRLELRLTSVTGKVALRWDASKMRLIPTAPPEIDEEEARRELARRFLAWLGPASVAQFSRWSGVSRAEAAQTWKALEPELVVVDGPAGQGAVLTSSVDLLNSSEPVEGARLLPPGDPYLYPHAGLPSTAAPPGLVEAQRRSGLPMRIINGLTGRLLLHGAIVGAWGRQKGNITMCRWRSLDPGEIDLLSCEALSFRQPLGQPVTVSWLDHRVTTPGGGLPRRPLGCGIA